MPNNQTNPTDAQLELLYYIERYITQTFGNCMGLEVQGNAIAFTYTLGVNGAGVPARGKVFVKQETGSIFVQGEGKKPARIYTQGWTGTCPALNGGSIPEQTWRILDQSSAKDLGN